MKPPTWTLWLDEAHKDGPSANMVYDILYDWRDEHDQLIKERETLQATVATLTAERDKLVAALSKFRAHHLDVSCAQTKEILELRATVASVRSERDDLQTKLDFAVHDIADAQQHIVEVRSQLDALAQERDRFYQQMLDANTQWEKDHEAVCEERDEAQATVARLTAERDRLVAALDNIIAQQSSCEGANCLFTMHAMAQIAQDARAALAPTQKEEA